MSKFLHLSTSSSGGAGMIPLLTHTECLRRKHDSVLLVKNVPLTPSKGVISIQDQIENKKSNKWIQAFNSRGKTFHTDPNYYFHSKNERLHKISTKTILNQCGYIPDIICIYWTSGFINTETIRNLYLTTKASIRIFATDMGHYTGGCHYSQNCIEYQRHCQNCPAIRSPHSSRAEQNLQLKRRSLARIPITLVASRGQSFKMASSASLARDFKIIPNVLKVSHKESSLSKSDARNRLDLPPDQSIWLIGSLYINDKRKGLSELVSAFEHLKSQINSEKKPLLLIIGEQGRGLSEKLPFPTQHLGQLDFKNELPLAFAASDAFLSPSLHDTGPYMVNLSIFYGCPVLSFDVGIAQYLVGEKGAGFIAKQKTSESLSQIMKMFSEQNTEQQRKLRDTCKSVAKEELIWTTESWDQLFQSEVARTIS